MKKLIIVLIFVSVISPVFAQPFSKKNSSDMYYINVPVEKVYPSGQGYIVQYVKINGNMATIGIPNEWFMDADTQSSAGTAAASMHYIAAGRAEIINLPNGRNWPSMSVFYKEGKLSHVRLYVHSIKSHRTWGNIPQGTDTSRFFSNDKESFNFQH